MKKILVIAVVLFLTGEAHAQVVVKVRPVAPVIIRPAAPNAGYVWIEPEWVLQGGRYVYVNGYWAPPRNGYVYVPGYWYKRRGGHVWVAGHWRR